MFNLLFTCSQPDPLPEALGKKAGARYPWGIGKVHSYRTKAAFLDDPKCGVTLGQGRDFLSLPCLQLHDCIRTRQNQALNHCQFCLKAAVFHCKVTCFVENQTFFAKFKHRYTFSAIIFCAPKEVLACWSSVAGYVAFQFVHKKSSYSIAKDLKPVTMGDWTITTVKCYCLLPPIFLEVDQKNPTPPSPPPTHMRTHNAQTPPCLTYSL